MDARHLFEDKAFGARDDRPGLKSCLDFFKSGETLVVWKLGRLGRSLPRLLESVAGLRDAGAAFRSLAEGMDTNTPHGELLFHIFGAHAKYEHALTREQIQAPIASARRRSRHGGRSCASELEKVDVNTSPIRQIAPLGWEHVGLTGDYFWGAEPMSTNGLRAPQRPVSLLVA